MKRRGRKRKLGHRHRSGDLIRIRESPALRAAAMPHRKGLKDPLNQLAESELGRLQLRGKLEPQQVAAGQEYARLYRSYMATLAGPATLTNGSGGGSIDCGGCLGMVGAAMCICERRKREYLRAHAAIAATGHSHWRLTQRVAIENLPISLANVDTLGIALWALAQHFGLLTKSKKGVLENIPSTTASSHGLHLPPQGRR